MLLTCPRPACLHACVRSLLRYLARSAAFDLDSPADALPGTTHADARPVDENEIAYFMERSRPGGEEVRELWQDLVEAARERRQRHKQAVADAAIAATAAAASEAAAAAAVAERQQVAEALSSRAAARRAAAVSPQSRQSRLAAQEAAAAAAAAGASFRQRARQPAQQQAAESSGVSAMWGRRNSLKGARAAAVDLAFGEGKAVAAQDQVAQKKAEDPDDMWATFIMRS